MQKLIEQLCWWLAYCEGQDVHVPREMAMLAVEEWVRMARERPLTPQPATPMIGPGEGAACP